MQDENTPMNILVAVGSLAVAALVVWTTVFNIRGRRREREIVLQRGGQTASDFAALFEDVKQQRVAEKLFPYLQRETFTRHFSFSKDDLLWKPPLGFTPDDLDSDLNEGFWAELGLGLALATDAEAKQVFSSQTVGELVAAITNIYSSRYSD
jgi:hypothetical protein